MPRNQFQRMVFAFITVVITVHAFVFYNIYVLNGDMLRRRCRSQDGVIAVLQI